MTAGNLRCKRQTVSKYLELHVRLNSLELKIRKCFLRGIAAFLNMIKLILAFHRSIADIFPIPPQECIRPLKKALKRCAPRWRLENDDEILVSNRVVSKLLC